MLSFEKALTTLSEVFPQTDIESMFFFSEMNKDKESNNRPIRN